MTDLTKEEIHAYIAIGIIGPTSVRKYHRRTIEEDVCDCCGETGVSLGDIMSFILDWCLCKNCDAPREYYDLPHVQRRADDQRY
jgi:hypothetical protein